MKDGLTRLYPMVQFEKDTWEIDEFDLTGCFLLIGEEKALLIDCGYGIGDLRGAVEQLTDKPVELVISHAHPDHCGGLWQWETAWTHASSPLLRDEPMPMDRGKTPEEIAAGRRQEIRAIADRVKGHISYAENMFNLYGYDIERIHTPSPEDPKCELRPIEDGHVFDLGGRRVTAYHCPGHTPDELVFLDSATNTLLCCDAVNYNMFLAGDLVDDCEASLIRMRGFGADRIMNSHHDYRAMGAPLGEDCLPNLLELIRQVKAGTATDCLVPSFWGDGTLQRVHRLGKNFLCVFRPGEL